MIYGIGPSHRKLKKELEKMSENGRINKILTSGRVIYEVVENVK